MNDFVKVKVELMNREIKLRIEVGSHRKKIKLYIVQGI